jgi:nucleotide-binding universal stress UspA family protein
VTTTGYTTIVIGVSREDTSSTAATAGIALARALGAHVHLIGAYEADDPAATKVETDASRATRAHLDAVARLDDQGFTTHARPGDPADAILNVAEEVGADLIVVGSVGMHRRVLGSVPNTVAHRANCSVTIVKTT